MVLWKQKTRRASHAPKASASGCACVNCEVAAQYMRPDRVAIEGQIVRVENRELWSVLGPAGVVAGV